jgi:hypothetical protein
VEDHVKRAPRPSPPSPARYPRLGPAWALLVGASLAPAPSTARADTTPPQSRAQSALPAPGSPRTSDGNSTRSDAALKQQRTPHAPKREKPRDPPPIEGYYGRRVYAPKPPSRND